MQKMTGEHFRDVRFGKSEFDLKFYASPRKKSLDKVKYD